MLPDVSEYFGSSTKSGGKIDSANDFCLELLKEQGVALVPGEAFGADRCVRLSYAASETLIRASLERLSKFVASLANFIFVILIDHFFNSLRIAQPISAHFKKDTASTKLT